MKKASLKGKGGPFDLHLPVTMVGRGRDCDIFINDEQMSRHHAVIVDTRKGYYLLDLKSSNGVFVNDERTSLRLLEQGDKIRVGTQVLELCLEGSAPPADGVEACDPLLSSLVAWTSLGKDETPSPKARAARLLGELSSLHRHGDRATLLRTVCEIAVASSRASRAYVVVERDGRFLVEASRVREKDFFAEDGLPPFVSRSAIKQVCMTKKAWLVDDPLGGKASDKANVGSLIYVPIHGENKVHGVLCADTRASTEPMDRADSALLSLLTHHAAAALARMG